jgi:outer membrane protein TolC
MRKLFLKIFFVFVCCLVNFNFVQSFESEKAFSEDWKLPAESVRRNPSTSSGRTGEIDNKLVPNKNSVFHKSVRPKNSLDPIIPSDLEHKREIVSRDERQKQESYKNNTSTKTLTLEQSIELAYKHKPSIQALNQAKETAKITRRNTLSSYMPQVSGTAKKYVSSNYISGDYKSSIGISASQLVYNFAGPQDRYKIAGKDINKAEYSVKQHKNYIRLEVEKAFLNAWLLQKKEDYITKLYIASKETFAKNQHQKSLDILAQNEWLQATVDFSNNMTIVQSYQDELNVAEQTLSYLTGQKQRISTITNTNTIVSNVTYPETITVLYWDKNHPTQIKPIEHYYQLALKSRSDLKIKDEEISKQKLEGNYYLKKYLPGVSLFGRYDRYETTSSGNYDSKEAGIKLSWNIFDGLTNYFNKSIADGNKVKTELEKQDLQQSIKLEIQTAHSGLCKILKEFNTANITYKKEHNDFELKKQQFSIGQLSKTDYFIAEQTWQQSELAHLTAKVNVTLQASLLEHACGYSENM